MFKTQENIFGKIFIGSIPVDGVVQNGNLTADIFSTSSQLKIQFFWLFLKYLDHTLLFSATQCIGLFPPSALLQLSKYIQIVSLMSEIYPA